MPTRPNILVLMTDQQSATMLSCAGNRYLSTPFMDAIAAEGVRFERAYCTNPVCVPSRFSLMTGLMPGAIGMVSNRSEEIVSPSAAIAGQCLGHRMRQAGYEAIYAGKAHLPKMSLQDVGFEQICQDERDDLADACAQFLTSKPKRPFCMVASFINPHDICYMAIRDFKSTSADRHLLGASVACATLDAALSWPSGMSDEDFFNSQCPPLPANWLPQEDEPEAIRIMLEARPFRMEARQNWSSRRWREHRWAYARLTEVVDRQIGRVWNALRASGLADNTLVVFTSDHGDMDAAHQMEHKSTLYEEVCRIPLIIRPPGGARARIDASHLVSNGLDLLPTLCDYAGAPPLPAHSNNRLTGLSLRKLVDEGTDLTWRPFVPVECAIGRAVVTERYKYCRYDIGASHEQLIDLAADPLEQRNALNDPASADAVGPLREMFDGVFGKGTREADVIVRALTDA